MSPTSFRPPLIPAFRLPAIAARIGGRLPQWPHGAALAAALNAAVALRVLDKVSLAMLEGKLVVVEVEDSATQARLMWRGGLFRPVLGRDGTPELHFRAPLATYLKLLTRQEDADTLFFRRELSIEGDTELGLAVKNLLDAVELPRPSEFAAWLPMPGFIRQKLAGQ